MSCDGYLRSEAVKGLVGREVVKPNLRNLFRGSFKAIEQRKKSGFRPRLHGLIKGLFSAAYEVNFGNWSWKRASFQLHVNAALRRKKCRAEYRNGHSQQINSLWLRFWRPGFDTQSQGEKKTRTDSDKNYTQDISNEVRNECRLFLLRKMRNGDHISKIHSLLYSGPSAVLYLGKQPQTILKAGTMSRNVYRAIRRRSTKVAVKTLMVSTKAFSS